MAGGAEAFYRDPVGTEADAIDAALIERYWKVQEINELSNLLSALGNSVGRLVPPAIEKALHDSQIPVRAAAARALRLADAPEVDSLLAPAITDDSDSQVRAAATFVTIFRRRNDPLVEARMQAAKTDSAEYVRSDAIAQLRAPPTRFRGLPETLAWIAEHEAKPGIWRLAGESQAPPPFDWLT